jgi:tRNA nucleotidyltransferase/poly(A) polymerase
VTLSANAVRDFVRASPIVARIAQIARTLDVQIVLVGGAVRDLLLRRMPGDLDFAVQGNVIQLARRCADALGGAFYIMDAERGVARVILKDLPDAAPVLDFVACRGDTWDADLRARDFTLNAIACALSDGVLIDPCDGAGDIARRRIRQVGPDAIRDDPVRAIRGIRLAHQFGFAIEPDTEHAIRAAGAHLGAPSAERLRDAFAAVLALPSPGPALHQLDQLALLGALLPEYAQHSPEAHAAVLGACEALPDVLSDARAALPDERRSAFDAHFALPFAEGRERVHLLYLSALLFGTPRPERRIAALKMSADEASCVRRTLAALPAANTPQFDARWIYRFMRACGDIAPDALLLACSFQRVAGATCSHAWLRIYFDRYAPDRMPPPLLTGETLLRHGAKPGASIGRALEAVREAQLIGELDTPDAALTLALSIALQAL